MIKLIKLASLLLIGSLVGCGSNLSMNLQGAAKMNPNLNNASLPVVVKVFQLSDQQAFKVASFKSLWMNPQQALGKTLLSVDDVTVVPNSKKSIKLKYHKDTKFVGFVAVFRVRQGNTWRVVKPVKNYTVKVQGNKLIIE